MKIFDGLCDLGDHMSTEILAEVCQSDDLVEELASGAKFENDIVVLPGLGEVDQFGDVGVIQVAHNLDFLKNICSLRWKHVSNGLG